MAVSDQALGMVETHGLVPAIEAADAMVKAANVTLLGMEITVAALVTIQVVGETGAVTAAVAAGVAAGEKVGTVVSSHIIPRPDAQTTRMLSGSAGGSSSDVSAQADLEDLTVENLRRLARGQPDFPIQGREISKANKDTLLAHFRTQT